MSGESYTRWRATSSDDDDDDDDGDGTRRGSGGGGGVSIITAPSSPPAASHISHGAQARVICVMVLGCVVCLSVGVWVGREWGRVSAYYYQHHPPMHLVVPAPRDHHHSLAQAFLHNLSPHHVDNYFRELTDLPKKDEQSYIEKTWRDQGWDTTTTAFTADIPTLHPERPSTLTVNYSNGSSEVLINILASTSSALNPAFSAGKTKGVLVYGHYGRREDLSTLQARKVPVKGVILLLRQGRLHPGVKVHNAGQAGAAGVLLYPDPEDYQGPEGRGDPYPEGMGLPGDGVVWESLSTTPGDPATPSLPSIPYVYRIPRTRQERTNLPVLSVSSEVAGRLLDLMGGPEDVPEGWSGGLGSRNYSLGGAWNPEANVSNITLAVSTVISTHTITNVHATLPAVDHTKVVMVGSHYGCEYGSSRAGLAALLAMSRALALSYLPQGTTRRIVLSAWAATDHGMIGSTEFTQLHRWWVDSCVVGYLSLDGVCGGAGSLRVLASPVLRQVVREAALVIPWPEGEGATVRDGWRLSDPPGHSDVTFGDLGSGGDFVSFVAQRGVPAAQFRVRGKGGVEEYSLRHSQYDTYDSYATHLDPNLTWTHMIASLVGASVVVMSESVVPPLAMSEVSGELYNAWRAFLHHHLDTLIHAHYNFSGILDAVEAEILRVEERLSLMNDWYHSRPYYLRPLVPSQPSPQHRQSRQVEGRLWWLTNVGKGLVGERGVGRDFTTHLTLGPDPEDPEKPLHFPHVCRAITRALLRLTPWSEVHLELSYVLAALASYRTIFPSSDLPPAATDQPDYKAN